MALERFGFLVTGTNLDPAVHRHVMRSAGFEMIVVGMSSPAQAPAVARGLVDGGVQLLELCGGFGPVWTARVLEAIEHRIPVGSVGYGPESIDALQRLFAGALPGSVVALAPQRMPRRPRGRRGACIGVRALRQAARGDRTAAAVRGARAPPGRARGARLASRPERP